MQRRHLLSPGLLSPGVPSPGLFVPGVLLLGLVLGVAGASAQDSAGSDDDVAADERREHRYREVSFAVDPPPGMWDGQPGYEGMLRQFADFGRAQAGESVELLALRLGRDPEIVRRTNGLVNGHVFGHAEMVCLERYHQRFPDEDLEFVAAMHATDVVTLRALNGLSDGEAPEPWARLRVPAQLTPVTLQDHAFKMLKVFQGDIRSLLTGAGPLDVRALRLVLHEVTAEDDWASIAAAHRVSVASLQLGQSFRREWKAWKEAAANPDPANAPATDPAETTDPATPTAPSLSVSEPLAVAVRIPVIENADLYDLVQALDHLCGDVPRLLVLNEVEEHEQLLQLEQVDVPLATLALQFAMSLGADAPAPEQDPADADADDER